MKNELNFYTKLIATILDSCCTYVVTLENLDIKLISYYGNQPLDLDTLKLLTNNFDPKKKSFAVIDINDFKNKIKNGNFDAKNIDSVVYLPILDENKITIGYLISNFKKQFDFSKSQEKTVCLLADELSELLREDKIDTTKDLKSVDSPDFKQNFIKESLIKTFKFSNDVFCIIDKNNKFEFVSNSCSQVWGYTPEEMIGTLYSNYVLEEDIPITLREGSAAKEGFDLSLFENRYVHKNGSIVYIMWSVHYEQKEGVFYCIAKDMTHYKQLVKKVEENESLLLEAQKVAKMGSWNFDFKKDKLTWSDGLYAIFEINKELFSETHSSYIDFINPEDRDFVLQTSKNTQETGEPFNIVYRIKTPSGEERFVEEFGYSEKDSSGKIIRLFGTAHDITERKKNEALLQDSNNKYQYLFENSPLPLFLVDFETLKILDCNAQCLRLYGYTKDEFVQLTIKDIHPKEELPGLQKATENETVHGEILKRKTRHLKKNG